MKKKEKSKLCAILSYFLVGIIWYFVDEEMKKDKSAKFHAKQALFLLLVSLVISIAIGILASAPFIGWIIMFAGSLLQLGIFVLWMIGLIKAIQGENKPIPIIGEYAEKFLSF
ncbi:MAG: DUF4870 domain-containing protein [Candidatus Woesearchaeota archaeon]